MQAGLLALGRALNDCHNTGKVSATCSQAYNAEAFAGGITGAGTPENCYNTGEVYATATASNQAITCAGGIIGMGGANDCYNIGTVSTFASGKEPFTTIGGISGSGTLG